MKLSEFTEGLDILKKYFNDPNGYHIGSEHDQFYVYATDKPVSDEDVKILLELGWFQPETNDDDGYSPEDGWSVFT